MRGCAANASHLPSSLLSRHIHTDFLHPSHRRCGAKQRILLLGDSNQRKMLEAFNNSAAGHRLQASAAVEVRAASLWWLAKFLPLGRPLRYIVGSSDYPVHVGAGADLSMAAATPPPWVASAVIASSSSTHPTATNAAAAASTSAAAATAPRSAAPSSASGVQHEPKATPEAP
jgi:hypothetical protein